MEPFIMRSEVRYKRAILSSIMMREASNDLTYQVMIKCLWPIQYSDLIIGLRSANESNAVCHGLGANLELALPIICNIPLKSFYYIK